MAPGAASRPGTSRRSPGAARARRSPSRSSSSPGGWPGRRWRPRPRRWTSAGGGCGPRSPSPGCPCRRRAQRRGPRRLPYGEGTGRRGPCSRSASRCTRRAGPRSPGPTNCSAPGVPTLVVQGGNDPFGKPEEFPEGEYELVEVPYGDHGFAVPKRAALGAGRRPWRSITGRCREVDRVTRVTARECRAADCCCADQ